MILASFFSEEDALLDKAKVRDTFELQITETLPFRCFWDTKYSISISVHYHVTSQYI